MSFGDIRLGETHDLKFGTSVNGVPTALVGGTIAAYVDNGTTEITAGITLSADFDSRVGLNNVRVVATSGNGYGAGTNVDLVLTAGTVGGDTVVGRPIGSFSIEKRSAVMPTVAGRTLDVSAGGEAGLDWANIGSPTTAQNLSATNIDVDQIVASVSGAIGSVAAGGITAASFAAGALDAVWATATRTLTSYGTLVADVATAVWGAATRILTAGTNIVLAKGVGVTGFNDLSAAQVNAEADTALADYDGPTHAELTSEINDVQADIAALTIPTAGAVADAVWDEAIAGHLSAGSTGEALSNAGSAGVPPTAAAVADAVWDEARAGHVAAGSFGQGVASVQGNVTGSVDSVTAGVTVTTNNDKTNYGLSVAERNSTADALLDRTGAIETGVTPRGAIRLALAALAGKLSGAATTTVTIRNGVADSKNRIVATVDADGNRTAVSTDQT